jgi:hypothetical protein
VDAGQVYLAKQPRRAKRKYSWTNPLGKEESQKSKGKSTKEGVPLTVIAYHVLPALQRPRPGETRGCAMDMDGW